MEKNVAQYCTVRGPVQNYGNMMTGFLPLLHILHMPAWMAKGIAGLGGACRVQFRKSDGHPGSVPGTVG